MADENELDESAPEQATLQLNAGLKSCRAVVDNYNALLTSGRAARNRATPNERTSEQPSASD